jgi:hypothetical protein
MSSPLRFADVDLADRLQRLCAEVGLPLTLRGVNTLVEHPIVLARSEVVGDALLKHFHGDSPESFANFSKAFPKPRSVASRSSAISSFAPIPPGYETWKRPDRDSSLSPPGSVRSMARSLSLGGWKHELLHLAFRATEPTAATSEELTEGEPLSLKLRLGDVAVPSLDSPSGWFDPNTSGIEACLTFGVVSAVMVWNLSKKLSSRARELSSATKIPRWGSAESFETDLLSSPSRAPPVDASPTPLGERSRTSSTASNPPSAPCGHSQQGRFSREVLRYLIWRDYCLWRVQQYPFETALPGRIALWPVPWSGVVAPVAAAASSGRADLKLPHHAHASLPTWAPPSLSKGSSPMHIARSWFAAASASVAEQASQMARVSIAAVRGDLDDPTLLRGLDPRMACLAGARTGYPLVDAAVRCVATTGTLPHDLARLVLVHATQYLQLPWQLAAQWLSRLFLVCDFATLAMSCQWWLGFLIDSQTPAPYPHAMADPCGFRYARSRDPTGVFVVAWCPELADVAPGWRYRPFGHRARDSAGRPLVGVAPHPCAWLPGTASGAGGDKLLEVLRSPRSLFHPLVSRENARKAVLTHVCAAFEASHHFRESHDSTIDHTHSSAAARSHPALGWSIGWFDHIVSSRTLVPPETSTDDPSITPCWDGLQPSRAARLSAKGVTMASLAKEIVSLSGDSRRITGPASTVGLRTWGVPVASFAELSENVDEDTEGSGWRLAEASESLARWGITKDSTDGSSLPLLAEEDVALVSELTNMETTAKDWSIVCDDPTKEIKAWMKPSEENPAIRKAAAQFVMRGWKTVEIARVIADMSLYTLWDSTWGCVFPIRRLDEVNEAVYFATDPPRIPIAQPRDFPMSRHVSSDEGTGEHVVVFRSIEHRLAPPRKGFTRGLTLGVIGFVVQSVGDPSDLVSRVTFVTATDARGNLPTWLVNWIAKFLPTSWRDRCLSAVQDAFGPPRA